MGKCSQTTRGQFHKFIGDFIYGPSLIGFEADLTIDEMVSNVMSKNETAPVYKRQSNMLIGVEPWESTSTMQEDYKPVWCKFCDTSDTESQFDQHEKRWIAVCNHCQGIIIT